jgi:hypothetical protein
MVLLGIPLRLPDAGIRLVNVQRDEASIWFVSHARKTALRLGERDRHEG